MINSTLIDLSHATKWNELIEAERRREAELV